MRNGGQGWCLAALASCVLASVSACGGLRAFTRPEGEGAPSAAARRQEIAAIARFSGVTVAPADGAPLTAAPVFAIEQAAAAPLDLAAALALADSGNRRIAEARALVRAAAAEVGVVRSTLLPATTATARYDWLSANQEVQVHIPAGLLPLGTSLSQFEIQPADFGIVNSQLALPLDLSGELRATLRAAQAGYRGTTARAWATTLEQELAVVRAYYGLLEAEHLVGVSDQTTASYTEQLRQARLRYDKGRATRNEILIVEVALAETEQLRLRRRQAIADSRRRLNELLGLDIAAATRVADERMPPELPALATALALAQAHNPMLTGLLEDRTRLAETETSIERSRLPRFQGGAQMQWNSADLIEPQLLGGAFLGLSWDLDTNLNRESRLAEVRAQIDRSRLAVEGELRALEAQVRSAHEAVVERLAAHRTAEIAVDQAAENLRIRARQLDAGRADSEDVLIAESLLSNQRAVLATALYGSHIRRGDLQRLIGLSLGQGLPRSIEGKQ